jgi:hypothetical protein
MNSQVGRFPPQLCTENVQINAKRKEVLAQGISKCFVVNLCEDGTSHAREGTRCRMTKLLPAFGFFTLGACAMIAQTMPAPPRPESARPPSAAVASRHGRVQTILSTPDGSIRGLFLGGHTAVALSPALSRQLASLSLRGREVFASGPSQTIAGSVTVEAEALRIGGTTYTASLGPRAGLVPPPPGPGAELRGPIGLRGSAEPGRPEIPPPPAPAGNGVPAPPPPAGLMPPPPPDPARREPRGMQPPPAPVAPPAGSVPPVPPGPDGHNAGAIPPPPVAPRDGNGASTVPLPPADGSQPAPNPPAQTPPQR